MAKCSGPSKVTNLSYNETLLVFKSFILVFRYSKQNCGDHETLIKANI